MEFAAPWSDRIVNNAWDRIRNAVPEEWMPTRIDGSRSKFEELGCGHFGCVMPTNDPDIVLKMTSDKSEAQFASLAQTKDWVPGLTKYKKVVRLEGAERRRRPVYLLWREAATDVGFLLEAVRATMWRGPSNYDERAAAACADYLGELKDAGREAQRRLEPAMKRRDSAQRETYLEQVWSEYVRAGEGRIASAQMGRPWQVGWRKGAEAVGFYADKAYDTAGELLNNPVGYAIGECVQHYLEEEEILLADLHLGNIGKDSDGTAIIIDPGLALQVGAKNYPAPEVAEI